jgi:hypothetical protein
MAWALVQGATEMTWSDYEQVAKALNVDADPPAGLVVHAAGEVDGKWRSVDVWESEADYNRFREERLMPAASRRWAKRLWLPGRRRRRRSRSSTSSTRSEGCCWLLAEFADRRRER